MLTLRIASKPDECDHVDTRKERIWQVCQEARHPSTLQLEDNSRMRERFGSDAGHLDVRVDGVPVQGDEPSRIEDRKGEDVCLLPIPGHLDRLT